jgi:hypothetical protein
MLSLVEADDGTGDGTGCGDDDDVVVVMNAFKHDWNEALV